MDTREKFFRALKTLKSNYRNYDTTRSSCFISICPNEASAGELCANCCEEELAEILDDKDLALKIHKSIKDVHGSIEEAVKAIKAMPAANE